jgi:hypothetical protein
LNLLLSLAFFLATGSNQQGNYLGATSNASSLTIDFRDRNYLKTFSEVHLSKGAMAAAKGYEAYQSRAFGKLLADLKKSGAATIKVSSTRLPDSLLPDYLIKVKKHYEKKFRVQQLVGFSGSGANVGARSWGPLDSADLTSYLFKISDGSCRLDGFKLFVPATWFTPKCQLQPVRPNAVLRAALSAHLSIPDPRYAFSEQQQALSWIVKNRIPYVIKAGAIYCPPLKRESFLSDRIPLKMEEFGSKYWISIGASPWDATFHQSAPDLQQVVNHINLATDPMGRKFLTPWNKHW